MQEHFAMVFSVQVAQGWVKSQAVAQCLASRLGQPSGGQGSGWKSSRYGSKRWGNAPNGMSQSFRLNLEMLNGSGRQGQCKHGSATSHDKLGRRRTRRYLSLLTTAMS